MNPHGMQSILRHLRDLCPRVLWSMNHVCLHSETHTYHQPCTTKPLGITGDTHISIHALEWGIEPTSGSYLPFQDGYSIYPDTRVDTELEALYIDHTSLYESR